MVDAGGASTGDHETPPSDDRWTPPALAMNIKEGFDGSMSNCRPLSRGSSAMSVHAAPLSSDR